jgi:hypothetical protein
MFIHLTNPLKGSEEVSISVSTIDGCQGDEYDIVIFSSVRANEERKLGFLKDLRRLNVAITRPRYTLIIIGHFNTICNDRTWSELITSSNRRGFCHDSDSLLIKEFSCKWTISNAQIIELMQPNSFLFENGVWKLSFTKTFLKSVSLLPLRKNVIRKLLDLSNGYLKLGGFLVSALLPEEIKDIFYSTSIDSDHLLIWSVDVQRSLFRAEQCLKIWDLVTHRELDGALKRVKGTFLFYSAEYLIRCRERHRSANRFVPKIWENDSNFCWFKTKSDAREDTHEVLDVNESVSSIKFFQLSSKVARLLFNSQIPRIDLPFQMSAEEEQCLI